MKLSAETAHEGMVVTFGLAVGTIDSAHFWGVKVRWVNGSVGLFYWDPNMIPSTAFLEGRETRPPGESLPS